MLLFRKRVPLAQTLTGLEQQAAEFLLDNNIPISPDTIALFGAAIQQGDQGLDTFEPKKVARAIRKAVATRHAFYLIHPDKKPKPEEPAAGEHANELKE